MKKEEEINYQIFAVAGAAEALKYAKAQQFLDIEQGMKHVLKFAASKKDPTAKLLFIGGASKALSIYEKDRRLTEKEIMGRVVKEIPQILKNIEEDSDLN